MWHPRRTRNHRQLNTRNQRGAAFMVMLVIMIIGVITALVGALGKVTLQTALNEKNGGRLAQAKEVLLGYAVNGTGGGQRPGDLPYPDRLLGSETPPNYDGKTDSCPTLQAAPTPTGCLGRLPWGSPLFLSMASPSENDPTGFMPWYAVSGNMVDPAGVTMNSELLNTAPHTWLTVRDMNGNVLSNRVAFVIIIPGAPINGQLRPLSPNLAGPNQYLDSITVPAGCTAPCVPGTYSNSNADDDYIMGDEHRWIDDPANPGKQIEDSTYNFNDKLIYVTIDELMPLIEKRIAREVKNCLDSYAAVSANKYPWAAPVSTLGYTSATNTKFGRIPDVPVITSNQLLGAGTTTNPVLLALFSAIADVRTARINCIASDNATNTAAMSNAGINLVNKANAAVGIAPITSGVTNNAITAGQRAQDTGPTRCDRINSGISVLLENALAAYDTALGGIMVNVPEDMAMQLTWPAGCFTSGNMAGYWPDWKRLMLYQVSDGYRPNNGVTASCGGTCLSVSGSGNPNAGSGTYRAAIALAGKKVGAQARLTALGSVQNASDYLELNNQNNKPTNLTFDTYKPTDTANYSNVNDLVLCLDGKVNCK